MQQTTNLPAKKVIIPESFEYLGKTFKPIETLKGSFISKSAKLWGNTENSKPLDCINKNGYSHSDFYKAARKAGCGKIDVFELDGENVIPCNSLMYYGEPKWYTEQHNKILSEQKIERTKGEWFISGGMVDGYELRSTNGEVIISQDGKGLRNRANTDFICKAVNNYDSLLNALKNMVNEYDIFQNIPENYKELEGYPGDENPRTLAMIKAIEAIKKAEQDDDITPDTDTDFDNDENNDDD